MKNLAATFIRVYALDPFLLSFNMVKDFNILDDYFFRFYDNSYLLARSLAPTQFLSKLTTFFTQINDSFIIDTTRSFATINHTSSFTFTPYATLTRTVALFPDIIGALAFSATIF